MERLEKGKGKEWSIKKREFHLMKEWEVSLAQCSIACWVELIGRGAGNSQEGWRKRNGGENGAEQALISQDRDLSENGAALANTVSIWRIRSIPPRADRRHPNVHRSNTRNLSIFPLNKTQSPLSFSTLPLPLTLPPPPPTSTSLPMLSVFTPTTCHPRLPTPSIQKFVNSTNIPKRKLPLSLSILNKVSPKSK